VERQWNKMGALAGVVSAIVAIVGIIVAMMVWLLDQLLSSSSYQVGQPLSVQ
jgi:hypothetical protein